MLVWSVCIMSSLLSVAADSWSKISMMWSWLFQESPLSFILKYFPPFADLSTFVLISIQCIWAWIFIDRGLDSDWTNTTGVFNVLTGTLSFILPLRMNAALSKNKACLDSYNAFCGDIMALGWDVVALHKEELTKPQNDKLQEIFDILVAMPLAAKWHFRESVRYKYLKSGSENRLFVNTKGGNAVQNIAPEGGPMSTVDGCFYKLLDLIKELGDDLKGTPAALRSWERAYGSWGNMGNLSAYVAPVLFTYVLYLALIVYSIVLPYEFRANGYDAVWIVAIIGYFFLGLNVAGSKVGNAFAEDAMGFQTVTSAQKSTTEALMDILSRKNIVLQLSDGKFNNQLDF